MNERIEAKFDDLCSEIEGVLDRNVEQHHTIGCYQDEVKMLTDALRMANDTADTWRDACRAAEQKIASLGSTIMGLTSENVYLSRQYEAIVKTCVAYATAPVYVAFTPRSVSKILYQHSDKVLIHYDDGTSGSLPVNRIGVR